VAIRPSTADTVARAGQALEREQRPADAAAMFREALRRQADREPYLTSLGRMLLQTRDYIGARDVLERAMARNVSDPQHPRNLASVHRVRAREESATVRDASLAEADRLYAIATTLAPGLPALWEEWANVDAERRRLREARQKLAKAIALDDSRYESWMLNGIVRTIQGDAAGAIVDLDRALQLKPGDAGVLRRRAAAFIVAGRLDDARRDLDAVLQANPGDDAAARLRARVK
jgi:tetratricopeptide (TPR) repeat protein